MTRVLTKVALFKLSLSLLRRAALDFVPLRFWKITGAAFYIAEVLGHSLESNHSQQGPVCLSQVSRLARLNRRAVRAKL